MVCYQTFLQSRAVEKTRLSSFQRESAALLPPFHGPDRSRSPFSRTDRLERRLAKRFSGRKLLRLPTRSLYLHAPRNPVAAGDRLAAPCRKSRTDHRPNARSRVAAP